MAGNQKIKILYLMKILFENTDDERGTKNGIIVDILPTQCQ